MSNQKDFPAVLGVYLGHDLGACLIQRGEIVCVIEEERLNRFKHGRPNDLAGLWNRFEGKFGYFPWASVCYCLDAAGIAIDDLDAIMVGDHLWASAAEDTIRSVIPIRDKSKVIFVSEPKGAAHHFHHALSAFLASPFDEASVLVVDADGNSTEQGYEAETGFYFENRQGRCREIFKNRYKDPTVPRSGIGWTYEQVTLLLGFANPKVFLADAGKTMGLSSWGQPRPEFEKNWISRDGFNLEFSGFHQWLKETGYDSRVLSYREGLATVPGGASQYAKDLAHKAQSELEGAMLYLATEMHRATRSRNLCLAGGVALNSVANGVIAARGPYEKMFVQPAANDSGQAIGLAYHGHLLLTSHAPLSSTTAGKALAAKRAKAESENIEVRPIKHAFGGRRYDVEDIRTLLRSSGLIFRELPDADALVEDVAEELSARRIVGWFHGASEYGPRSLGHRSILANPDTEEMKDLLNRRVKFRESFRPFAPSALLERASEVFELKGESPYMLLVVPVREKWKSRVPAITHVDGTARVQTVDRTVEPLFHSLISAFERKTGLPLIVNTSFNLRGMPIVESPRDALQCFLYTDMDCLYLERFRVDRPEPSLLFPSKAPGWEILSGRDALTGNEKVSFRNRDNSKQISLDGTMEFASLCEGLDGTRSLLRAWEEAMAEAAPGAENRAQIRDAVCAVQSLVRQGAMRIRVGSLTFGESDTGAHWWQASSRGSLRQ